MVHTDNVYVALAELCAAARREVECLKAGQRGEGLILLLAYPTRLTDPASLVRTAERYAPHASVWLFDPSCTPRLRAVRVEDVEGWASANAACDESRTAPNSTPPSPVVSPGRTAENGQNRAVGQLSVESFDRKLALGREHGKDGRAGGLLSSEELSMLLAIDPLGGDNDDDRSS